MARGQANDAAAVDAVIDLLSRDDVREAVIFAAGATVPLDKIQGLPVPRGFTRSQTEQLIATIERIRATYSPIVDGAGRLNWFTRTPLMGPIFTAIDRHCTTDSRLHQELETRAGIRFLVESNVDEGICSAILDGVEIDYREAKGLLMMQRQPRSSEEQLLQNQFELGEQLPAMAEKPWTPDTMLEVYHALTRDVPLPPDGRRGGVPYHEDMLEAICEYATSPAIGTTEHVAITASILRAIIVYWQPFQAWNGLMSRLAFRLFALKQGYPVLGHLPIAQSELELGRHPAGIYYGEAFDEQLYPMPHHNEADATAWLAVQLSLIDHALHQLLSRRQQVAAVDEAVQQRLDDDATLNHRQRSILGRALLVPGATFRITYHRTIHRIGYATAHRDFAELVAKGYLVEETRGRALVFRAAPDLEERLGSIDDVGRRDDYDVKLRAHLGSR